MISINVLTKTDYHIILTRTYLLYQNIIYLNFDNIKFMLYCEDM